MGSAFGSLLPALSWVTYPRDGPTVAARDGRPKGRAPVVRRIPRCRLRDHPMKYLTIAVLLAIVAGAILHYFKHDGKPPPAESSSGWMQR